MRSLKLMVLLFLRDLFKIKSPLSIYIYSVLIGALSGLMALLFSLALSTAEDFSLNLLAGLKITHPPGETPSLLHHSTQASWAKQSFVSSPWQLSLILFLLPTLGGLVVGIILQFVYREASGAGTDSMIHAFHYRKGKIQGRGAFFKAIATIFTLASGGSGGREGPTAYIGAALGSRVGRILGAGARARRTLLLAGTAGGLGAIFRAPLGGAMTAVEIVYREDIESDSLVPCLLSSVTAYLIFTAIAGPGSYFVVPQVGLLDYKELFLYCFLGLLCYSIGFVYVSLLRFTESAFQKWDIPLLCKPTIGGMCIGVLGLFFPQIMGSGMGYVHTLLGEQSKAVELLPAALLPTAAFFLLLAFLKILATALSIGSGGSGGLFAPSLFVGAMLGGSTAMFSKALFPDWEISTASFMLVGMGAFFAGVARTPFSAMIMICDIVGSYALLPPLMIVSMLTFILSSRSSSSLALYKGQLENRFKSPAHFWDMRLDILDELHIAKEFPSFSRKAVISSHMLLKDIEDLSLELHASDFVVMSDSGEYRGMLSLKEVRLTSEMQDIVNLVCVDDVCNNKIPAISLNDTLAKALQHISKSEMDKVAVVGPENKLLGYLHYHDIFTSYHKHTARIKGVDAKQDLQSAG